ncbi:hypothetical protein ATANTOWER_002355 [Ataeniobius toweri]|uniref:Uncharacterized protein n=1 Tax=Ataeniobius toweri TaxID=208326 RepID=A0ABU7C714_9TELE|nr:hypothetical protein [Ataeniobius toweri]
MIFSCVAAPACRILQEEMREKPHKHTTHTCAQFRGMTSMMGTIFGTFKGTDQFLSVLPSTFSRKIKRYYVLVPKRIIVTLREWKNRRFTMPVQEHSIARTRAY